MGRHRARRPSRRWLTALVVMALLTASGAGDAADPTSRTDEQPWGETAVRAIRDEVAAGRVGVEEALTYADPEVVVDDRPWGGRVIQGRDALRSHLVQRFGMTLEEVELEAPYLDPQGAAVLLRHAGLPGFTGPAFALQLRTYGPGGVRTAATALSLDTLARQPGTLGDARATLTLAARYAQRWSRAVPGATAALYRPDARILDGVERVDATGRAAIRHLAGAPLGDLRIARIPASGASAVYVNHPLPQLATEVSVIYDVVARCPRRLVVRLTLDGGRIAREQRYHDVAGVRRCSQAPADGWWSALAHPEPTGSTIRLAGEPVVVEGATPDLEHLLRWAIDRFAVAGLPPPRLSRVTFAGATGRCAGVSGRAVSGEEGTELFLCLDARATCRDAACATAGLGARMVLLHEMAHAWVFTHADRRVRDAYLARTGAGSWNDHQHPWSERGVERAAETMMWGLLDRPVPLPRIGDPPCRALAAAFRLLTGRPPLRTCADPSPAAPR
jgi:hypothetical protein